MCIRKGKDDDHKHSTCDRRAQILTLFKSTTSDNGGQRLAAHCRYTRVYLLAAEAEAETDGLFTMSESFQNIDFILADVFPASRCINVLGHRLSLAEIKILLLPVLSVNGGR